MELHLGNKNQAMIANLLWVAKDQNEVRQIVAKHGPDAEIVYQMMMAAYCDTINDTDLAIEVLAKIK